MSAIVRKAEAATGGPIATQSQSQPQALKKVVVYTDGGCQGNPGPGAWACVLEFGRQKLELAGGELATTNNRMELSAALHALKALNQRCAIVFYTDSEYLRQGITAWVSGWKRNGWRTKTKDPVKNRDLWQQLDDGNFLAHDKAVRLGHGHPAHERLLDGAQKPEEHKRHEDRQHRERGAQFLAFQIGPDEGDQFHFTGSLVSWPLLRNTVRAARAEACGSWVTMMMVL